MTRIEKALIAVSVALVVLLAIGADLYVKQVRELATAQAFSEAQKVIIAKNDALITDAQKRLDARDKAFSEAQQQFADERAKIITAAQAAAAIKRNTPGADDLASVKRDQLPAQVQQQLPNAPSYEVMTEGTAVRLGQQTVDLKACNESVTKLTADNKDLSTQKAAAESGKQAAQQEAQKWQEAAKGGTVTRRAVNGGKLVVIGAACGAIAAEVLRVFVFKKK